MKTWFFNEGLKFEMKEIFEEFYFSHLILGILGCEFTDSRKEERIQI
jgi:hypothetical protein